MIDQTMTNSALDLMHVDPIERAQAVYVIRRITPDLMEAALTDPAPSVRVAALWRMHIGLTAAQLERALTDPDVGVRMRAIFRPESLTMAQLNRALSDPNSLVQQAASIKRMRNR